MNPFLLALIGQMVSVTGLWILASGAWNDAGMWDDAATWKDN